MAVHDYTSGDTYIPADDAGHTYVIAAYGAGCVAYSGSEIFADAAGPCVPAEAAPGDSAATAQVWDGDKITQSWPPAARADAYILYRGVPGDLPNLLIGYPNSCVVYWGASTDAQDPSLPDPGQFFWYLVTGLNDQGEGPAGDATAGPRIVISSGSCP